MNSIMVEASRKSCTSISLGMMREASGKVEGARGILPCSTRRIREKPTCMMTMCSIHLFQALVLWMFIDRFRHFWIMVAALVLYRVILLHHPSAYMEEDLWVEPQGNAQRGLGRGFELCQPLVTIGLMRHVASCFVGILISA